MDTPEFNVPTTPPAAGSSQLQEQLDSLHHLVVSVLILLVVVSGTLTIFLLRQWQTARKDLSAYSPGANSLIAEYNRERGPRMDGFINKLTDYGRQHPDFIPILNKYGLNPTGAPAMTVPAAAPQKSSP